MKTEIQEKRTQLFNLTFELQKNSKLKGENKAANVLLLEYYSKGRKIKYNTFAGWKAEKMEVKKGEKAFIIWGKPKNPTAEHDFKFFPLAYVFSEYQVKPIGK